MGNGRFSFSPAVKASKRVQDRRNSDVRRSVDTSHSVSTLGEMPVTKVQTHLTPPAGRWTTCNRM